VTLRRLFFWKRSAPSESFRHGLTAQRKRKPGYVDPAPSKRSRTESKEKEEEIVKEKPGAALPLKQRIE
jgi:hypothetical protein